MYIYIYILIHMIYIFLVNSSHMYDFDSIPPASRGRVQETTNKLANKLAGNV